jgi:hypothetical protein
MIIEDENSTLLDSKPLNTVEEGSLIRYISKLPKVNLYSKNINNQTSGKYANKLDLAVRNFIRALVKNELNLNSDSFDCYKDIVAYIKNYNSNISISENIISQLKRRGSFCKVPRNTETLLFVDYIKIKFPNFDYEGFFVNK